MLTANIDYKPLLAISNQELNGTTMNQNQMGQNQMNLMSSGQSSDIFVGYTRCATYHETIVPCSVNLIGMKNHLGQIVSFAAILRDVSEQQEHEKEAEVAKAKSEELLFQILPRGIVVKLNQGEKNISFSVPSATIMFIDIVRFSDYAASLTPEQIMSSLSDVFATFDNFLTKYPQIIKIKVIGDRYLVAGGIFNRAPNNQNQKVVNNSKISATPSNISATPSNYSVTPSNISAIPSNYSVTPSNISANIPNQSSAVIAQENSFFNLNAQKTEQTKQGSVSSSPSQANNVLLMANSKNLSNSKLQTNADGKDLPLHVEQCVKFGLDVISSLDDINLRLNANLTLRIGMCVDGPITAGIIGSDNPTFDIIGKAISIAEDLKNTDIPGRVQVPRATYEMINSLNIETEERGEITINKEKMVTYFFKSPYVSQMPSSDMIEKTNEN